MARVTFLALAAALAVALLLAGCGGERESDAVRAVEDSDVSDELVFADGSIARFEIYGLGLDRMRDCEIARFYVDEIEVADVREGRGSTADDPGTPDEVTISIRAIADICDSR